MEFLTKPLGRFPLGIWFVLVALLLNGFGLILFGQALSAINWEAALSLGLQEDSPNSADLVERTMGAVSCGEAVADTLVQGPLMVLTLIGVLQRRSFGFVTGVSLMIIWVYASIMLTSQRIGLYNWELVPDLSRASYIGMMMFGLVGIPGMISLICLIANRGYFDVVSSSQPERT